jgi:ketosteroid isomerase-like protein
MEELNQFLKEYENQTNTHVFENLRPLIAEDAVFWFPDGSYKGIYEIQKAFEATFSRIQDEDYHINNLEWLAIGPVLAVCVYNFHWTGVVNGKKAEGRGRGTNIVVRRNNTWQMLHEHLSA